MWDYKREERGSSISDGDYRVRIEEAFMTTSKSGNDMIKMILSVSGSNVRIYNYVVFNSEKPQMTNANLTQIFDGFGIEEGSFDFVNDWVGRVGAAKLKTDDQGYLKVSYFLRPDKAAQLPNWEEPSEPYTSKESAGSGAGSSPSRGGGFTEDDVPF